jgi:hypothetical protein
MMKNIFFVVGLLGASCAYGMDEHRMMKRSPRLPISYEEHQKTIVSKPIEIKPHQQVLRARANSNGSPKFMYEENMLSLPSLTEKQREYFKDNNPHSLDSQLKQRDKLNPLLMEWQRKRSLEQATK